MTLSWSKQKPTAFLQSKYAVMITKCTVTAKCNGSGEAKLPKRAELEQQLKFEYSGLDNSIHYMSNFLILVTTLLI